MAAEQAAHGAEVDDSTPWMRRAARAIALAMACFQLYTAFTVTFSPMIQRSVHLAFALSLLFLVTPARELPRVADLALRWILAAAGVAVTLYAAVEFTNPGIFRVIDPTWLDIAGGTVLLLLLLEATRRTAGPSPFGVCKKL